MRNLLRYEKYFFLLLVLLHLLPVLLLEFFVTHDGPSHVYNTYIIKRLLLGDELTSRFFLLNPQPVPNWLGHALLIFFNFFFAGNISERILIVLYITALPLSFRYLMLTLNKDAAWVSYLIFPFIYSLLFYLGFYNFCIGMPLLFYSLAFLLRSGTDFDLRTWLLLAFLGLLMYFSHIFILLLFLPAAFACVVSDVYFRADEKRFSSLFRIFLGKAGRITLALLPCLILSVYFVITHREEDDIFRDMNFFQHLEFLFVGRPLITLNYDEEKYYAAVFALIFWFIFLFTIYQRFKKFKPAHSDWLLAVSFLILAEYFLIPDAIASGSFVSHRLMLFFYFFSLLWVGTNEVPKTIKLFSAPVFVILSLFTLVYHYRESANLNEEAKEYVSTANAIEEKSVVLPVNYSVNWLHHNLSNYIAAKKNIIILDNYEAAKPHFPTMWKTGMNPYIIMNFSSLSQSCMAINQYEKITGQKIDFIIRWGFNQSFNDSCSNAVSNYLKENYSPVFTSVNGKAEVFKRSK